MIRVGIVATSSVVPKVEFEIGVEFLRSKGYSVDVHPKVLGEFMFYPAPDAERAEALIETALRKDLDALWCARGGYGATHLLPYLNRAKAKLKRAPKKTLLGYSDATALLEWFRVNLGWKTIHAPMPSLRSFSILPKDEWAGLLGLLKHTLQLEKAPKQEFRLTPLFVPKGFKEATAPVVGGNLFVWNSLLGTKDQGKAQGKILFLEEISENLGRVNRMMHHLEQAGGLKGVKALVLGDFLDCNDTVPSCLISKPNPGVDLATFLRTPPRDAMGPLRTLQPFEDAFDFIFKGVGKRNRLPVYKGLPVGHGPSHHSLLLGAKYRLSRSGKFGIKGL